VTRALVTAAAVMSATWVCLAQQRPTFHAAVDLVNFGVSVVDKQGRPVSGLNADDFDVIENGRHQTLKFFAAGMPVEAPALHLGLLLDTSGSMADDLGDARTAAIKFVNALDRAADFTLVDFDTEVRVARFGVDDYPRLVERIRNRKADGWTALYDAVGVYLNGAQDQDGQKVLVLYTDGGDTTSALSFSEMIDLLKASDVTVYAVGYMEHQTSGGRLLQTSELQRVAETTGGQAYFPGVAKDLNGVFDKIRQELEARYSLGYVSSDSRTDGAWRNVEIKLLRKDLRGVRLRTRTGYYAPYKPAAWRPVNSTTPNSSTPNSQ
jgi:Ca-activated chloride channel family protein